MRVLNPAPRGTLRLREARGEYRVRVRRPLRGAGVVTVRKTLIGKTLRPKHRLTAGIFQRDGRGPMRLQALAFPKPTTADSARRKAERITGMKVNPEPRCIKPGEAGSKYLEENPNGKRTGQPRKTKAPHRAAPTAGKRRSNPSIQIDLVRMVLAQTPRRGIGYRTGLYNGLVAAYEILETSGHERAAEAIERWAEKNLSKKKRR